MWQWKINRSQARQTIKVFLMGEAEFSKRLLIKAKSKNGYIGVNGEKQTVRYVLKEGDQLTVVFPEEISHEKIHRTKMSLHIIYEDKDLLVINKPATMPVIPSREHPDRTLANGVLAYYETKQIKSTIHVVTRLDRETSGLVLLAKNQYTHSLLSKQQRQNNLKRKYLAIVHGEITPRSGEINLPIGRCEDSIIKRCVMPSGKAALTRYHAIHTTEEMSVVAIQLETGRTHQIRVHFSYIGYPLIGDTLYGKSSCHMSRQALHCQMLQFYHPFSKKLLSLTTDLPADLQEIVDKVG